MGRFRYAWGMTANAENSLHRQLRLLYTGRSKRAARFRYALVTFDIATIVYFITTVAMHEHPVVASINLALGVLILVDFSARLWVAEDRGRELRRHYTIADMVVIASLFAAPFVAENLAVFRVLRALRLVHSYRLVHDLKRDIRFFRVHEDAILAGVNLFVFIFTVTSLVYVLRTGADDPGGIDSYIDALYFTVATLTTTGFGDITLDTTWGKLLSVAIMIGGVALFIRLAQAIFKPARVHFECPDCGLMQHEPDAIHCRHCGRVLHIETDGE